MVEEAIVVSKHPALVDFLVEKGLIQPGTPYTERATRDDVRGKRVYGSLPLHLAAEAKLVTEIPLAVPKEERDRELTLEQIREYARPARNYEVSRV